MNLHSGRAVAMMRMMGCNNGRYARNFLHSDCVIDEKTVVLQKKDNEGFGFVLRGAKGKGVPPELSSPFPPGAVVSPRSRRAAVSCSEQNVCHWLVYAAHSLLTTFPITLVTEYYF